MKKIITPATSANLCCGFDTFGLAVGLYNVFYVEKSKDNYFYFNDKKEDILNTDNLILQATKEGFDYFNEKPIPLSIKIESDIPSTRGLGSSATCITAGIIASFIALEKEIDMDIVFNLSSKMEGHPDNVAPCVFGMATTAFKTEEKFLYTKINLNEKYKVCAFIPDFKLSTKKARGVLPTSYKTEDVVFNIQRASILPLALERGDDELLKEALNDKIHEPYRIPLIKNYKEIETLAKDNGFIGTYLSGAGPTIMGIYSDKLDEQTIKSKAKELGYDALFVEIENKGIRVE